MELMAFYNSGQELQEAQEIRPKTPLQSQRVYPGELFGYPNTGMEFFSESRSGQTGPIKRRRLQD